MDALFALSKAIHGIPGAILKREGCCGRQTIFSTMKAFGMLLSFTGIYSVMIAVVQIILGRWK